jgi:transposase
MRNVNDPLPPAKNILALDLGKFKSVACVLDVASNIHRFETIVTSPSAVHDLLAEVMPDRLVIEACSISGWVCDIARSLDLIIQVANTNGEAWNWKKVKRKSDRVDAFKLTKLSLLDQLDEVQIPLLPVRQWKSLIKYRHSLVDRRTKIKNTIRSLLDTQGRSMPHKARAWTKMAIAELSELARPLCKCDQLELWRGQLHIELRSLQQIDESIAECDARLDLMGAADERVVRLQSIPYVGPRVAEVVVSTLGDPRRFNNVRQVSAYAGLVPKQFQSGETEHLGRITGQGPGLLRRVLVQAAWGMQRKDGRAKVVFDRLCHGQKTRRKKAAVALARKILIWCWAMMRDGTTWDEAAALGAIDALMTT